MQFLKLLCQAVIDLLKSIRRLPQLFVALHRVRRRELALRIWETERLDRIRNPSKYLGK